MDAASLWLVFGGVMAAMLVIPRVMIWIVSLVLILKAPESAERRVARALAPFFLHSGPWLLALAIGAVYYVASLSRPAWLWALLGGIAAGTALLLGAIALGYLRRRKRETPPPLTPERLLKMRRRFFWTSTLLFGGLMAGLMLYRMRGDAAESVVFLAMSLGAGWLWSWFMWQFVSAELLGREEQ